MIVTDLAMQEMSDRTNSLIERCGRWVCSLLHFGPEPGRRSPGVKGSAGPAIGPGSAERPDAAPISLLHHRSARNCQRAVRLGFEHRFEEARSAFYLALAEDQELDPTTFADFWELPRRGMFAAIEAYEDLNRYREAARLEQRILLEATRSARNPSDPIRAFT